MDGYFNGHSMCPDDYYQEQYAPSFQRRDYVELAIEGVSFETEKAYLIRRSNGSFWVPKAMCGRVRSNRMELSPSFKIVHLHNGLRGNNGGKK